MRRGSVLVLVMWLLVIAGAMLLGLNRAIRIDAAIAHGELEATRARWAARAGVEQARSLLDGDAREVDDVNDLWYRSELDFEDVALGDDAAFSVVAPPGRREATNRRFGLVDEASRVNVNHADAEALAELPGVTPIVVDAIIDWRDEDERARPGGAERGVYAGRDLPYAIRNGPLQTHRELLLIEGVDRARFYGEDGDGDGVLSAGENDGDAVPPPDNADGVLDPGLRRWTTVYSYVRHDASALDAAVDLTRAEQSGLVERFGMTRALAEAVREEAGTDPESLIDFENLRGEGGDANEADGEQTINAIDLRWLARHWEQLALSGDARQPGRINVNTAEREVLETVPGIDADAAARLVDRRGGGGGLSSVGELLLDELLDEAAFRRAAPRLTVRSNVFRVVSEGRSGAAVRRLEAVIDRGDGLAVLYWREEGP